MSYVKGADKLARKFRAIPKQVMDEVNKAVDVAAKDLIRTATILHPGAGDTRSAMTAEKVDGGVMVNFGPKSKVTEGDSGPRPFVNPALKATMKRRKNRMKRAVSRGVKKVLTGV